jgi:UDP-galactopyranose mutase
MSWAGKFQTRIGRSDSSAPIKLTGSPASPFARRRNADTPTLLCLSHLRWDFVYQRPQHLMSRFARDFRVMFFEEPVYSPIDEPLLYARHEEGVEVMVPHLPRNGKTVIRPASTTRCAHCSTRTCSTSRSTPAT